MAEKTYNPIHSSGPYENSFFAKIPYPVPGFAIVLTGNQCVPLLIQNSIVPSKGQIRRGKYNWMTQVDIRPHDVAFDAELLSKDNISKFSMTMHMSAQVELPDQVSMENITDVVRVVRSSLLPRLQNQASQYKMEQVQELREEILSSLGNIVRLASGILLTDISLMLMPNQSHIDQQEKIDRLRRKAEYERTRAEIADGLSRLYGDPAKQVFAEFAADNITVSEAADLILAKSSASFNENLRRFKVLVNTAEELGAVSPDVLENKVNQLFSVMLDKVVQVQDSDTSGRVLEENKVDQYLFAPPEE